MAHTYSKEACRGISYAKCEYNAGDRITRIFGGQ